jgi:signal transduction histidine kinase
VRHDDEHPVLLDEASAARSTARAVSPFVLAGLAALILFLAVSLFVVRELGQRSALRDTREFAELAARGIVEPALTDDLLDGDPEALERLDLLVQERILSDRVVRVKLWTRGGRIVYSDEPRLIGTVYPRDRDELDAFSSGEAHAELSDLSGPENRFEREEGKLYEVYARVRTPTGEPLLFETYQRSSALASSGREIWLPFAGALAISLLMLWLLQVPLAWRLASRLRRAQAEREHLLQRALEASADERRRIASDLHDGVVQELAGLSYSLSAAAEQSTADAKPRLLEAASRTRDAIRGLRATLVEIHPPNLRTEGLEAALRDLLAPLHGQGITTALDVPANLRLTPRTELLLFRAGREAIRNVQRHAKASALRVAVSDDERVARIEVADDGVGFTPAQLEQRRAQGHVGLSLLEETAAMRGGRVELRPRDGGGTTFVLEVPDR